MSAARDAARAAAGPMPRFRTFFLVATGIGALSFLRAWLDEIAAGDHARPGLKLLEEFSGAYLAMLLVPLVILLARRFPPQGARLAAAFGIHLVGALAFAITHTTLMWLTRSALAPLLGMDAYDYGAMPHRYLMELPLQLAIYAGVVVLTLAFDRYRRLRDAEVEATALRGQLTQAQLQALSRQIEPHFLFNTLNAISELMYSEPKAADEMMSRLSGLLRHAFQARQAPETTLAAELQLLDQYLGIMRLRLGDRLAVRIDIDDALLGARVPQFLLQPLVENAIRHGADPATQRVDIAISAEAAKSVLCLRVRDRGAGLGASIGTPGIGVANTAERIARMYGEGFGLRLDNADDGGAEAVVRLPLRLGEAN